MSFVSRREIWKGRGGSQDDENNNESDRIFVVTMSASSDNELDVAEQYGGPVLFDPHPNRPTLWVKTVDIRNMDESAYLWIVNVHYSDKVRDPDQKQTSPLSKPMKDSWGHASYTLPATEGWLFDDAGIEATDKTPVTSGAGEAFDPPEERNASRIVIACEVNLAEIPSWILDYNDVLNSDAVTIRGILFPKYTLRINTRLSDIQIEKGVAYRQVFYDLEARAETFLKRIPDRGYLVKVGKAKTTKATVNGMEPSQPVFLDSQGRHAGRAIATWAAADTVVNIAEFETGFASGEFTADDVGRSIRLQGGGTAGADHVTTIATFVTSTQCTIADATVTAQTQYPIEWSIAKPRHRVYRVDDAKPFSILNLPS